MTLVSSIGLGRAFAAETVVVFAAGSLKAPLTAIGRGYEELTGAQVAFVFGASGLLRDRIKAGEAVDVFASANMEHPRGLMGAGWTTDVSRFARNSLCMLAGPGIAVTPETALDALLGPAVTLGTSTPGADPSGDYAWELFRRAELVRPGAFAALSAKARQLTGGPQSPVPRPDRNVYADLVMRGEADIFLTYCTNARLAVDEVPALQVVSLPDNLAVSAAYGVAVRRDATSAAREFGTYLRSADGQRQMAAFGFDPP